MTQSQVYEGTLDEIIARYGTELAGHRLKVIVEEEAAQGNGMPSRFYETAGPEEWGAALRTWAANHDLNAPLLSDEALDRNSIYEGRGE